MISPPPVVQPGNLVVACGSSRSGHAKAQAVLQQLEWATERLEAFYAYG